MILTNEQIALNLAARKEAGKGYKSILIQAATGFGKSVCATAQIQTALGKGKKILFVVPRRDLVRQMSKHFSEFSIPHSFIAAGCPYNPYSNVYICTIGTLVNRLTFASPDVVFVDEAHYGSGQLDKIISFYKDKGSYIIGLSATPVKTNGQGLDRWFDTMVCGPSIKSLIQKKWLSEYRLFSPARPNLSGIKTIAGDYAKGQLSEIMEADRVLIGNAVNHYKEHALGRLNIAFCTSRKHSEITAQAFRDAGVPTMHIDGETPDEERKKIIKSFANRELLCITSVDLMHTGFDLGSQVNMNVTVESMSDLRPTKSLALQMQKWGRVLRRKNEPAIIIDHAGNAISADGTANHGFPDDDREWTLKGSEKRVASSEKAIPIKQCTDCFYTHRPAPSCPNCGKVYEINSRTVEEIDGELTEITREAMQIKQAKLDKSSLYSLIAIAKKRGMNDAAAQKWAARVLTQNIAKRKAK